MAQGNIWQLLSALGEMVSDDGSGGAAPKSQPTEQTVSAKAEQRETAHAVMLGGVPSTYEMMLLRHPCDSRVIPPEGDGWFLVSLHHIGELKLVGLWARPPSQTDTD